MHGVIDAAFLALEFGQDGIEAAAVTIYTRWKDESTLFCLREILYCFSLTIRLQRSTKDLYIDITYTNSNRSPYLLKMLAFNETTMELNAVMRVQ